MCRARLGGTALAVGALIAAACGSGDDLGPGRGVLGGTDTDRHTVRLADVHFDNFMGGSVPLSEITEEEMLFLRDRIPPIDEPLYEPAQAADWLSPDDLVLGFEAADGQAYAYPTKILNFHEIVNEELGGEPVLITYCPLCRSGVVYNRELEGQLLSFGNTSALFQSDLVMYDRETLSFWFQVGGEAIVGELADGRLEPLPSVMTTWDEWRGLRPNTVVLSRDTGFIRDYESDAFGTLESFINAGRFPFPVTEDAEDDRLQPAALVLGVELGGEARAYPIGQLGDAAVDDELGGEPIVVFTSSAGQSAAAFSRELDGRELSFELRDGEFIDTETGSEWSLTGEALSGPLQGERLEPLGTRATFWFAYVAAFPDTEVYAP